MLSGHGLVSSRVVGCDPPLSAYRTSNPSMVANLGSIIDDICPPRGCDARASAGGPKNRSGQPRTSSGPAAAGSERRDGELEDRRSGQPVDKMRTEVLGEHLGVVLPDRLVQARGRQ